MLILQSHIVPHPFPSSNKHALAVSYTVLITQRSHTHTHTHKFSLFGLCSQRASASHDIILSTDTQITLIAPSMEELLARSTNGSTDLHSKSCSALFGRLHVLLSVESWKPNQSYFSNVKFIFQSKSAILLKSVESCG